MVVDDYALDLTLVFHSHPVKPDLVAAFRVVKVHGLALHQVVVLGSWHDLFHNQVNQVGLVLQRYRSFNWGRLRLNLLGYLLNFFRVPIGLLVELLGLCLQVLEDLDAEPVELVVHHHIRVVNKV